MRTKFIKVSVEERKPTISKAYHTNLGIVMYDDNIGVFYKPGHHNIQIDFWLEEVPDMEDEMIELMKKLDTELDYQDRCREMTGELYECWDDLKSLLTKLKQ
ncbi:hypothetical protein [Chryseobacterium sp. SIMBA_028]|uniref:hypothetical protein n=1 Tax=Chryseobacterium sp. SIMBA_028 TaxID=3085771 RepID=UPI00397D5CCC